MASLLKYTNALPRLEHSLRYLVRRNFGITAVVSAKGRKNKPPAAQPPTSEAEIDPPSAVADSQDKEVVQPIVEEPIAAATPVVEEPIAAATPVVEEPIASATPVVEEPIAAATPVVDEPIAAAVAAEEPRDSRDPVQSLFLQKLKEYNNKASGLAEGVVVDSDAVFEAKRDFERDQLKRRYGGGNLEEFPVFSFQK